MKKNFLILILILIVFFFGCYGPEPAGELEMQFESSGCKKNFNANKTIEQKWLDEATLQIKVFVSLNCADKIIEGDLDIKGNKMVLSLLESDNYPKLKCTCLQEAKYTIHNLQKRDYEIELYRKQKTITEGNFEWKKEKEGIWKRTKIECEYEFNYLCEEFCYENKEVEVIENIKWNPWNCEWKEFFEKTTAPDKKKVLCFEHGCMPEKNCELACPDYQN